MSFQRPPVFARRTSTPRLRVLLSTGVLLLGCSRTGLDFDVPSARVYDGGVDPVADAAQDDDGSQIAEDAGACTTGSLDAALGTVLWQTTLTTDTYLVGPMAADPSGGTYFAHDGFLFNATVDGGSSIIALDPCGIVRWRAPWNHAQKQDEQAFLMVSGEQLIAENRDVEAFDLASGAHLWTADLSGLAGAGDLSGAYLGPPAAASDGTSYLTATNDQGATWLLAIDASGVAKVLTGVPNIAPNGSPTDLILDSAGRLNLSLAESNVFPAPGAIDVFGRDGSLEITTTLANVGPQNLLMSGTGFVLNESTGDLVGPDGGVSGRLALAADEPAVIDAQGNVFAVGQSPAVTVSRLELTGAVRWGAPFPGAVWEYYGGPVLGDGPQLFFLAQTLDADNHEGATLAAIDVDDGTPATWSFPGITSAYLLLTSAGEVVFTSGGQVVSVASGGERPAADAPWPTPRGGVDQRGAALGE